MPPSPAHATTFRALHKPSHPIVLTNVYDAPSASAVAALPSCKALATASYAVARAAGLEDDDLDLATNLRAARAVAAVAAAAGKPLTVDAQDGYGARLEEAVAALVEAGAVGINLEDWDRERDGFFGEAEAAERVGRAVRAAREAGVRDFVVNARCDVLMKGGEMEEVVRRGKAYLAAGATTVFVWGGSKRGVSRAEVVTMVEAFGGMLNVSLRTAPGSLTVKELAEIGVARISVGPLLQFQAMEFLAKEADKLLKSGDD